MYIRLFVCMYVYLTSYFCRLYYRLSINDVTCSWLTACLLDSFKSMLRSQQQLIYTVSTYLPLISFLLNKGPPKRTIFYGPETFSRELCYESTEKSLFYLSSLLASNLIVEK